MQYFIVDGHCDSILATANGERFLSDFSQEGHLDFPRLQGNVQLQFMALFIESIYKPNNSLLRINNLLDILNQEVYKSNFVKKVLCKKDLLNLKEDEVKILVSVEGGEALEGSLSVLRNLFKLGVRSLALTWNARNLLADGSDEEPLGGGLSFFGKKVVYEMNKFGMVIDVSHLGEKSFWDVLQVTSKPVIASHSCCKALNNHPRNLSDAQLKALGKNGGIIGINYYPQFLKKNYEETTIKDVIDHIIHASEIMGCEHVGLGSDFDGISCTPKGLEDVTKVKLIAEELELRGFSSQDIANIMGNNYLRVLKQVLPDE